MEIELRVSQEEFKQIKQNKKEIEKRFYRLDELENTLKALKLRYLSKHRDRLKKKLDEMEHNYKDLLNFEKRAMDDKEFLLKIRHQLSKENYELRQQLEVNSYENRGKT
ncbi:hypothetical protein [Thermococcus sp.]